MNKKPVVNIIGGGISGLSAGIYALMNGFEAHIFEKNSHPGGVCQSWNRNGYNVNGSIHWLMGSGPGTDYYWMWRELGIIENTAMYHHSSFSDYETEDGKVLSLFTDIYKLRNELLSWSPEDEKVIGELFDSLSDLVKHPIPFPQIGLWNKTRSAIKTVFTDFPLIVSMVKWQRVTLGEFASRFKNPHIRTAFAQLWHPEMSMVFILMQLAFAHMGSAGYPLGGSSTFIKRLKKRYEDLSGHFHANSPVKKIEIEDGKARAIVLENGISIPGNYFISAGDGHKAINDLLGKEWADEAHLRAFENLQTFPGLLYFSAGVSYDFHEIGSSISGLNMALKQPVDLGNAVLDRATFQIYNFDPTLAGPGKTLITSLIATDYSYWKSVHEKGTEPYRAERKRIADALMANLGIRFPGIRNHVDFSDVATPVTYENETGNYRGSYEGWLPTPASLMTQIPQTFSKLDNVFLSGHWVSAGGGMPPAAFTGRNAVGLICEAEGKDFRSFTEN
jgi:phytoene dehydrogenase-like protein